MNRAIVIYVLIIILAFAAIYVPGLGADKALQIDVLPLRLSDCGIYKGNAEQLQPGKGFQYYEPAAGLFTDYAEKQRLIKVPAEYKLTATHNGLPDLPDGTILVKTFYYWNDKRDTSKGKRLIETRLLVKNNRQWQAGAYVWNAEQTEAWLQTGSSKTPVTFIDEDGRVKNINYKVSTKKDCGSCHNSNKVIMPIGFTVRNLNQEVVRNKTPINQLHWLQQTGLFNECDPAAFAFLPNYKNTALPITNRARAYLDINCAHCHNEKGSCAISNLRLGYDIPSADTRITNKKERILKMVAKGRMPRLGTTVVDEAGLALLKQYLNTLQ